MCGNSPLGLLLPGEPVGNKLAELIASIAFHSSYS
jgi:hypothetical protein